jgi:hypothetical protein
MWSGWCKLIYLGSSNVRCLLLPFAMVLVPLPMLYTIPFPRLTHHRPDLYSTPDPDACPECAVSSAATRALGLQCSHKQNLILAEKCLALYLRDPITGCKTSGCDSTRWR